MATYPFLSDEWIAAAREIRENGPAAPVPHVMKMNLIVTEVPFGDSDIEAHTWTPPAVSCRWTPVTSRART